MPPVSALAKLRALLTKEAPAQANVIREAMRQTARTGKEHSVVGLSDDTWSANITRGDFDTVTPDHFDIYAAKKALKKYPIVDFHTHPASPNTSLFTSPSKQDLEFYSAVWGPTKGRDVRTIIATPTSRLQKVDTPTYNFFSTDDVARVLNPQMFDAARFELQKATRPSGMLRKIQDDPIMRDYLEGGGSLGQIIEELSTLLTMRRQAQKGLGRHEFELGTQPIESNSSVTPFELFKRLEEPSLDLLRSKKFKQGGAVKGALNRAREILAQRLFHGGSYKRGEEVTQPLYLTPSREMAESYVDPMRTPGSVLQELRPEVSRPAPERLLRAAARRHVPENEQMGYTPASAFDENLHDHESIRALIQELERRNYDSAIGADIGMGQGQEAPAVIMFPGRRAYAQGGAVRSPLNYVKECRYD